VPVPETRRDRAARGGCIGLPEGTAPRVVQVGVDCVPSSGGTYTLMHDFRRALQADIISVTAPDLVPTKDDAGVLHIPAGSGRLAGAFRVPLRSHPNRKQAERLLRSAGLIIIHGLFRWPTGWAYRIAREEGIAFWVVPHGSLDTWVFSYRGARKRLWMATVGRRLLRDARFVIAASPLEDQKANLVVEPGVRRRVVPWAVRPHQFSDDGRVRIREALGISRQDAVLLALGRLHPAKGLPELIRAVGAVAAPELHLVLVGPDSEALTRAACIDLAGGASANIHVVGPAWGNERFAYFDAADGFISLSHRESFGYTVAEAMAAGKPVIVNREAGITSLLTQSHCGWILDAADEASATAAIRAFLAATPTERSLLGSAGRNWVAAELSFPLFQIRLQNALRESLAPTSSSSREVMHP
jgi:glycosyltransferase involved in cell wall biosynthesis